jgi:hypothetical protein
VSGLPGRITSMKQIMVAIITSLLLALLLAGCGPSSAGPCAGHGGTRFAGGGWSYCNDGTQQAGY